MTQYCYDSDCFQMIANAKEYFPEIFISLLVLIGIAFIIGWRKGYFP